MQEKQSEWLWQWDRMANENQWLFEEWIFPNKLTDFRSKSVLDCGCGGGQHLIFVAPYCKSALGTDLNAVSSARENTKRLPHISLEEHDIATMDLQRQFDIVYSIGVLHHTDNPDASFKNIARHCKTSGRVIVWVYSHEGNFLNRTLLESLKRAMIMRLPRSIVLGIAHILTTLLSIPIYTIYLLVPRSLGEVGHFLPFCEYFSNWRKMSYQRNLLNVFDKLNAPQTHFITEARIRSWFPADQFTDIHVSPYKGVSWRGSGTKT